MKVRKVVLKNPAKPTQEFVSTKEQLSEISHELAEHFGFEDDECYYSGLGAAPQWTCPECTYDIRFYPITLLS